MDSPDRGWAYAGLHWPAPVLSTVLGRFWFAGLAMLLHPMLMVGVIAIPAVLAVPSVPQDLSEAAMKGAKLTAAQAETLEHQLAETHKASARVRSFWGTTI